jgi:hypothetical protein
MNTYRQKSAADAKSILESGASTLNALASSLEGLPYKGKDALSQAEAAFVADLGGDVEKANDVVDAAYKLTRDALSMGSENIRLLERFVGLHVPQMEVRYHMYHHDARHFLIFLTAVVVIIIRTETTLASQSN